MQTEEQLVKSNSIGSSSKFVNKRISSRSGIPPLINNDHVTVTDDQAKAGLFNEYFTSVGRPENGFIPSCSSNTESCLDSVEINESNMLAAIKKLKNNYSCGPDGLPALIFKRLQHVIVKLITIIYNQLFSVDFVSNEWKKAVITPVHKNGPMTTCSNYRPISITCVTSNSKKVLLTLIGALIVTHAMLRRLTSWRCIIIVIIIIIIFYFFLFFGPPAQSL